MAGAARDVGHHQRHEDAEHRAGDGVKHLRDDEHVGILNDSEQYAADRHHDETQYQQRASADELKRRATQGEISATKSCGTTMPAAINTHAQWPERMVARRP